MRPLMGPERRARSLLLYTLAAIPRVFAEGIRILTAAAQSLWLYSNEVGTPMNKGPEEQ